jgi:hypothetical protein
VETPIAGTDLDATEDLNRGCRTAMGLHAGGETRVAVNCWETAVAALVGWEP